MDAHPRGDDQWFARQQISNQQHYVGVVRLERCNEAEREVCEPSELVGMQQFRYRNALVEQLLGEAAELSDRISRRYFALIESDAQALAT